MECARTLSFTKPDSLGQPLVGSRVPDAAGLGKADLSDWVEVMEAVEALCPVWPKRAPEHGGVYKL